MTITESPIIISHEISHEISHDITIIPSLYPIVYSILGVFLWFSMFFSMLNLSRLGCCPVFHYRLRGGEFPELGGAPSAGGASSALRHGPWICFKTCHRNGYYQLKYLEIHVDIQAIYPIYVWNTHPIDSWTFIYIYIHIDPWVVDVAVPCLARTSLLFSGCFRELHRAGEPLVWKIAASRLVPSSPEQQ